MCDYRGEKIDVCEDCFQYLFNSTDSFYYYYTDEEAEQRIQKIKDAIKENYADCELVYNTNEEGEIEYDEFSWRPCELCGSTLGGTRYSITIL